MLSNCQLCQSPYFKDFAFIAGAIFLWWAYKHLIEE